MTKTIIIAEAGVNHNGNINTAYKLVDEAVKAKVDFIKFQTWKSEHVISKFAEKANYQKSTTGSNETMLEMEKKLELPYSDFIAIKKYCEDCHIGFLSTPFDIESARFLFTLGVDYMKIPSGEITNLPLLEEIASQKGRVILSTGMSTLNEISSALSILKNCIEIIVLHCNTQYPTPMQDINLHVMKTLQDKFGYSVGLSDHSIGIEVPIAAVALGAKVIEKHFTLDSTMEGPDHKASIEPEMLAAMVTSIRNIEIALGSSEKRVTNSEIENLAIARKSIVASKDIKKGELFTIDNITTKRPGNGLSPMKWYEVLNTLAKKDFYEDELIKI